MNDPETELPSMSGALRDTDASEAVHAVPVDRVLEHLGTSTEGLSSDEAARRLEHHGPNQLPEATPDPLWRRLGRHFDDVLIYILLVAAVLKAVLGEWVDFGVILAVAVANGVIGFVQEGRAERALAGLRSMLSLSAHTRRDGHWVEIEATDLVPGDVVRVRSGDRLPADMRLIDVTELRAEESGLTGESEPVDKQIEPVEADAGLGDRRSMAYSGSLVPSGRGVGVVTPTGAETEIGRISAMIDEVDELTTPLERQIRRFSTTLSKAIVAAAALMLVVGWSVHDLEIALLFTAAVAFAVAAIPEGLPAVVTITLSRGVQRMARRNAITRNLTSVETLGSVTVICSDKTGTLTRNEMTVQRVVTPERSYTVDGIGYEPVGEVRAAGRTASLDTDPDLHALVRVNALATTRRCRSATGRGWSWVSRPRVHCGRSPRSWASTRR